MEAGCHEEGGAVDRVLECEGRVHVLVSLDAGKQDAEQDGERQALNETFAIIVQ